MSVTRTFIRRVDIHPLRVLYLALDLAPETDDAESIHAREVVKALTEQGHSVMFAVSGRLSHPPSNPAVKPVGGGSSLGEFIRSWRLVRQFRPEVIYERRFLPKIAAALRTVSGIPSFVEINGIVSVEAEMLGVTSVNVLPSRIKKSFHKLIFRRMTGIVTVTPGLAEQMARSYGLDPSKISVVENGANTHLFRPLDKRVCRERLGLDAQAEWLCFEGGLAPWHGVETAIQSVRILADRRPSVKLAIVGDGPCRGALEALVQDLEIKDRVRFFGRVPYEQVPIFIGACDLGVGPFTRRRNQQIGSSPIKVYEYIACGRPVVVSRIPGLAEWVSREGLGNVADPDDPSAFAKAIEGVLSNPVLLDAMVQKGPAFVKKEHSWDAVASKLAHILQSALDAATAA